MPGLQYPFSAFTVEQCPRSRTSWNASSTSRGCPDDVNDRSTYHCVPNQQLTALIEFCYPRQIGLYERGTCLYLTNSGYLNQVRCTDFSHGCPEKPYFSNEIYKYQECLAINKQSHCYKAAESCRNAKSSTDVSPSIPRTSLDYIPILLGVILPTFVNVILLCALFIKFRRKKNSSNKDNMNPEQDQLLQKVNQDEVFIETRAYQKAINVLLDKKYVFIKGNPGDGKTTIAKQLLKELKISYNTSEKVVIGLKELCGKQEQNENTAFFVDNIFGEYVFRSSEIEQWERTTIFMENVLSDEIDKKGNFLIVTIRNDMYSEIRTQLQFKIEFIERALVDISDSDNKLRKEEMKQIFDYYVDIPFQTNEFYSAFSFAPPLGFPQSCKLFGNNKILQCKGPNFFKNPSECLSQYVEDMYLHSKPKFSVLIYVLMKNGRVPMSSLSYINFDIKIKRKALDLCPDKHIRITSSKFIKYIDGFMGSFLMNENGSCKFSHSCIQNVIQNTLIKYDLSFVIEYCHLSILISLHIAENGEKTTNLQTIDQSFFAEIFSKIVYNLKCNTYTEPIKVISCLQFWKNQNFCTAFKDFVGEEQSVLTKTDENDASLLIHFAEAGHIEMVKFLLKIITDDKQKYDALNQATLMNHRNVVQIILNEGVTPDAKSCFCAIQNGNKDIVEEFINAGLDLLQVSESRHPFYYNASISILAEACLWERLNLIAFILKICPALSNVKNNNGDSIIHFVAFAGATDALKALIANHTCDPFLKTEKGATILHRACQNGKYETAKYIMSQYPDLLNEEHDVYEEGSILHMVAAGGNIKLFKIFEKPWLTRSSTTGETVLHSSCSYGRFEMSTFLLKCFPRLLNIRDGFDNSILHATASGGNIKLLKYLVEKRLDINEKQAHGKTVLHLCSMNGKIDMCKYLVNEYHFLLKITDNDGGNALHNAAWGGHIDIVRFLLEKGLDIRSTAYGGKTALHVCCLNGKIDMCKYLVKTYLFLLDVTDNNGGSAIHDAAWGGNIQILKFLIDEGLDINSARDDGRTALHQCCRNREIDMYKFLVNNYPNLVDVEDKNGNKALLNEI